MKALKITKHNFEQEVKNSDKPVLIDFYADWCGPCKMLGPVVEQLAEDRSDIKVCKVNVDDEGELASAFGVMSIPTVVTFKNGNIHRRGVGYMPKDRLLKLLD